MRYQKFKILNTNFEFTTKLFEESLEKVKGKGNKYINLYQAIKNCIINVDIPNNWTIPSTRYLAESLGLSRTTVIKAYELLLLEKLIVSKTGSGYNVSYEEQKTDKKGQNEALPNPNNYPKLSSKGESFLNNISLINRNLETSLAFRPGLPPLDIFPVNQWKNLLNTYWRHVKSSTLSYARSTGIDPLRKSICDYLNISRNIKCDYNQIVIVSGSLQSLYLISSVLIDKGDNVIIENPTFPNVHSIFKSAQANLLPITIDNEGIDIKKMDEIQYLSPKIIHVTPSNHYPLGIKMSLNRRKQLIQWASNNKALIIENDYENEIANHLNSVPSIFSLDTEDRTIYMGTFNRLLHPSIRLGYMIVPKYLIAAVEALQEHSHRFVAPSIQVVMNQFIEKNYLYKHLKNTIEVAQERLELFASEFENCKKMSISSKDFNSLHVVARFHDKITDKEEVHIIEKLKKSQITSHSLSKCYIGNKKEQGLILGYSSVRKTIIQKKVRKMIEILSV